MALLPNAKFIYSAVERDFFLVDACIQAKIGSNIPLIEKIGRYITSVGGKRIRPLLVLLTAKAVGYDGRDHIELAALIEFLHTATLLHDDVVDSSSLRRGEKTVNLKWGNSPSILVGDFLYSRAFQSMVSIGNLEIMSVLANATNTIAEGEVWQLLMIKNTAITESQYMDIIHSKTAVLFEACCHTAALLVPDEEQSISAMKCYGCQLGVAFQLVDDWLDYSGDVDGMGKNIGDDFAEGKVTLPIIHALKNANSSQLKQLKTAFEESHSENIDDVLEILHATHALVYTKQQAEKAIDKALSSLVSLHQNEYTNYMHDIGTLLIDRVS